MLRVFSVVLLLSITALMSACGMFSRRDLPYDDARNQAPLQVPADLDRPPVDDALRIPDVTAAPASRARPGGRAAASLLLADSADSVWRRVGLALERMGGDVRIVQADQAAGLYQVSVSGAQPVGGGLRRIFRREQRVHEQFNLVVEPSADGTIVRAEGGAALARDLLQRLGQRLGG